MGLMPVAVYAPDRAASELSDESVIDRVRGGETALYEVLMRRYNQRLYRISRAILRNDTEAEDVMQEAYVRAYEHLDDFLGEAKFSTWLTKIAVYEAMRRVRRRGRIEELDSSMQIDWKDADSRDPEQQLYDLELRRVLESAVDALPESYRAVFVLRLVEGLNVAETAACLDVAEETVKTRLHRARALVRKQLHRRAGLRAAEVFPFHLSRCDRVVEAVFRRITRPPAV